MDYHPNTQFEPDRVIWAGVTYYRLVMAILALFLIFLGMIWLLLTNWRNSYNGQR